MRFFLDTEFIESGPDVPVVLLSIGVVAEDGREYYAVADVDHSTANEWVRANVIPQLGDSPRKKRTVIAREVAEFVGDNPIFYGWYADYDWVVLAQSFGTMMDLPAGWPMYCRDLKQTADEKGIKVPKIEGGEHNALEDARWNKFVWETLFDALEPAL